MCLFQLKALESRSDFTGFFFKSEINLYCLIDCVSTIEFILSLSIKYTTKNYSLKK